jgi:hypothetical protein
MTMSDDSHDEAPLRARPRSRRSVAPAPLVRRADTWQRWLVTLGVGGSAGSAALADEPQPLAGDEVRLPDMDCLPQDELSWEKLWLATQQRPWMSLSVIPVGKGISTRRVTHALAAVGTRHLGSPVLSADATDLTLPRLRACARAWLEGPARVLIALGPLGESPACLALAKETDACILCLALGESDITEAREAVAQVGEHRFIGSVLVRRGGKT